MNVAPPIDITTGARFYGRFFLFVIVSLPFLALVAPRAFAFIPPVLGILGYLIHRFVFGQWVKVSRPLLLISVVSVGLASLSSLWAVDPEISLERALKICPIFIGGACLWSLIPTLTQKTTLLIRRWFPYTLLAAAALCCFDLLLFDEFSKPLMYSWMHPELEGHIPKAVLNRETVILVLFLLPALFILKPDIVQKSRALLFLALVVIFGGIFFYTDNQSVHLAFGVSALVCCLFPRKAPYAWFLFGVILVFGVVGAPWIAQFLFKVLPPYVEDISWFQNGYAINRMAIWNFISLRALEQPVLGYGIEAVRGIRDFSFTAQYHNELMILHPHNFAVQIWIEFGVVGAALTALLCIFIVRTLSLMDAQSNVLYLVVFVACLSLASTTYGLWQGWWLGTFFVMLTISRIFTDHKISS